MYQIHLLWLCYCNKSVPEIVGLKCVLFDCSALRPCLRVLFVQTGFHLRKKLLWKTWYFVPMDSFQVDTTTWRRQPQYCPTRLPLVAVVMMEILKLFLSALAISTQSFCRQGHVQSDLFRVVPSSNGMLHWFLFGQIERVTGPDKISKHPPRRVFPEPPTILRLA